MSPKKANESAEIKENIKDSTKNSKVLCYLDVPAGMKFSYSLSDQGMSVYGTNSDLFAGTYQKISDLP